MEAVGTADEDFYRGLLDQLSSLIDVEDSSDHQNANETDLNFLFAVIKTGKPKCEYHSMLLAHIGVTHRLCMGLAKDTLDIMRMSPGEGELSRSNEMLSFYERKSRLLQFNVLLLNKSSRTFVMQLGESERIRRGDERSTNWQQVTVAPGAQAVVNNVAHGAPQTTQTADPPALTDQRQPAMPIISEPSRKKVRVRLRKCDDE